MSLFGRRLRLRRGRPASLDRLPADERRPVVPVDHDPAGTVTTLDPRVVVADDLRHEQPVVVEPSKRPVRLVDPPHDPAPYDPARCCWCGTVLAPPIAGEQHADCAACRATGAA